jgi:hypothetical protein
MHLYIQQAVYEIFYKVEVQSDNKRTNLSVNLNVKLHLNSFIGIKGEMCK